MSLALVMHLVSLTALAQAPAPALALALRGHEQISRSVLDITVDGQTINGITFQATKITNPVEHIKFELGKKVSLQSADLAYLYDGLLCLERCCFGVIGLEADYEI